MSRHRCESLLKWGVIGVTLMAAVGQLAAQEEFSPASRQRGRAVVEYRDKAIHVVAAYNYSQRNHDSRWLLIEAAVSTQETTTIQRNMIALRTPQGRQTVLASQSRLDQNVEPILALMQNSRVVSHNVVSYFTQQRRVEAMQLFRLSVVGFVHNDFVVDRETVAFGPLFFESTTGAWAAGTYAITVRHSKGDVQLPIRLE